MPSEKKSETKPHEEKVSIDELRAKLEEAEKAKRDGEHKAAECLDKFRRLQADMENLQKITKRQVESVTRQASEGLMVKLLPILDGLQRAEQIARTGKELSTEEMAVGLGMLRRQLLELLETEGLTEIPTVGQPLNPELHEVVNYVETDEAAENMVMEEVRRGYLLNGKVIRPSMVVVSKTKASETDRRTGEPT